MLLQQYFSYNVYLFLILVLSSCVSKVEELISGLDTNIVFESITSAAKTYDTNRDGINKCCKGIKKSSGTLNGIPLQWMYYEDYLKSTTSTEVGA